MQAFQSSVRRAASQRGLVRLLFLITFSAVVAAAGAYSFTEKMPRRNVSAEASGKEFFVFLGQSNMDNAWGIPPRFNPPNARVKIWRECKWQPYEPGRNASNQYPAVYGPEIEFLHRWFEANPGKSAYVIKQATGGTSLAVHWKQDGTGTQWNALVSQYKAAKAARVDLPVPTVVIMQGEGDSMNSTFAAAYQANFSAMFKSVRALLGSSTRIIVGRVDSEISNRGYLWAKIVQQAQSDVVKADANAAIISTDSVELDPPPSPHFSKTVGIPHLGLLLYQGYVEIAFDRLPGP